MGSDVQGPLRACGSLANRRPWEDTPQITLRLSALWSAPLCTLAHQPATEVKSVKCDTSKLWASWHKSLRKPRLDVREHPLELTMHMDIVGSQSRCGPGLVFPYWHWLTPVAGLPLCFERVYSLRTGFEKPTFL